MIQNIGKRLDLELLKSLHVCLWPNKAPSEKKDARLNQTYHVLVCFVC